MSTSALRCTETTREVLQRAQELALSVPVTDVGVCRRFGLSAEQLLAIRRRMAAPPKPKRKKTRGKPPRATWR